MAEVITNCDCGQLPALETDDVMRGTCALCAVLPGYPHAENCPNGQPCEACGAEAGEECRPMCIGQAAEQDRTEAEAHVFSAEQDAVYAHLTRAHCSCGWHSSGYSRAELARTWWERHVNESAYFGSAAPQ